MCVFFVCADFDVADIHLIAKYTHVQHTPMTLLVQCTAITKYKVYSRLLTFVLVCIRSYAFVDSLVVH